MFKNFVNTRIGSGHFVTKYFFIIFLIGSHNLFGQINELCGTYDIPLAPDTLYEGTGSCFDIEEVLENCESGEYIWVKINIHFFTTNDCKGSVQVFPYATQTNLYSKAEEFINQCNTKLDENAQQWQVSGATPQCVPFRYVIKGVYIHCLSNPNGISLALNSSIYAVNDDSELNIFFADVENNFTGYAQGYGGESSRASIDWINTGNFNHEIGHLFNLYHAHNNDYCDDTPEFKYNWDGNCDGVVLSPPNTALYDKYQSTCWSIYDTYHDENHNSTNDCEEASPCVVHPCCSWANVNNNVMAYNAYQNCFSKDQILRVLEDIEEHKCDFIESIGACPPPSAFVSQTPRSLATDECFQCLYLQASVNEERYRYFVYKNTSGGQVEVINSGWVEGQANTFCYSTIANPNKLDPNSSYTIVLTVEDNCGQSDTYTYTFTTPTSSCGDELIKNFNSKSPNPTDGTIRLKFDAEDDEIFNILVFDTNSSGSVVMTDNFNATLTGENEKVLDVSSLSNGTYYVIAWGQFNIYGGQFVKI